MGCPGDKPGDGAGVRDLATDGAAGELLGAVWAVGGGAEGI